MKVLILTLLISSLIISPEAEEFDFDLPLVLDATGVPECIQACLSDLFDSAVKLLSLRNPVERFSDLCKKYDNASLCIAKQDFCTHSTIFEMALSGLDEVCTERAEDIAEHKDCLKTELEPVLKECDSQCHLTKVLIMLSGKGNPEGLKKFQEDHQALQKDIASICVSFGCMSSCLAKELNMYCPPAGTTIVKALLKPFFTFSNIFEEIGPRAKLSIYRQEKFQNKNCRKTRKKPS
ncbi:unnamed protein product [Cylicocyclus nassatus]|uniref:Chondroitin proteoglycan 4 domain-containing protein n=1 Tax=Cylicocyclus nassatus TaxID=53992 RepID=A0AA36H4G7_CYLNA|nr:unnamed protein product [Cylicocyclus nassatus]